MTGKWLAWPRLGNVSLTMLPVPCSRALTTRVDTHACHGFCPYLPVCPSVCRTPVTYLYQSTKAKVAGIFINLPPRFPPASLAVFFLAFRSPSQAFRTLGVACCIPPGMLVTAVAKSLPLTSVAAALASPRLVFCCPMPQAGRLPEAGDAGAPRHGGRRGQG